MSRSSYVYVVCDGAPGPLAVFTVKRELVAALRRFPYPEVLSVYRCRDASLSPNGGARITRLDMAELLEGK